MKCSIDSLRNQQYQVDAFTDLPFGGNPACVLFRHGSDSWMQSLAAENNLSETAFLSKRDANTNAYTIRWYAPRLCVYLLALLRFVRYIAYDSLCKGSRHHARLTCVATLLSLVSIDRSISIISLLSCIYDCICICILSRYDSCTRPLRVKACRPSF